MARRLLYTCGLAMVLAGCTRPSLGPLPSSGVMVDDRLYFGRDIPGGGTVSDSAWSAFVAGELTPRFPNGLTVWHADGQWLDSQGALEHEETMVLELVHAPGVPADSTFEHIAAAYKSRFHQDAVMRVTSPATRIFY